VAAALHLFGHSAGTITRWLRRAGAHSATLHQRTFRHLHLPHLQLDQIGTRLRSRAHVLWLSLALDPISKLSAVLDLAARTQEAADSVIHTVHQQLAPGCLAVLSSDGLNHSFYALSAHFGQWVAEAERRVRQWQVATGLIYGQVKKAERRRRLVRVTPVMRCGTREQLPAALQGLGLSGRLTSAFVERLKNDRAPERRGPHSPHMLDDASSSATARASGMVARLLPLRPPARVIARGTWAATPTSW
jgi:hypothetical protein